MSSKRVLLIARAQTDEAKDRAEAFAERVRKNIDEDVKIETTEISELFFELSREKVAIYHPEKHFDLRDFDLVVIRHIGKMSVEAHAITQYCENFGIKYTDEYLNRLLLDNKMSTGFLLWFAGIKNWPLTFYGNLDEMKRRFTEFGGRAILKDNEGSRGYFNFLVNSESEVQRICSENPEKRFMLQEFIPNEGDLRVLVFGNQPAMVIKRRSNTGSHLNNISQGGRAAIAPIEMVDPTILDIAKKAAEVSKLQVAGVDVMVDSRNGKIYLLEVNNAPQVSSGSFTEEKAKKYAEMLMRMVEK